jgi:hypothetical protein
MQSESYSPPSSKPPSRIPSRPLSSTTTATHSTITPLRHIPTNRDRGRWKHSSRTRTDSSETDDYVPENAHALHRDMTDLPFASRSMPPSRPTTPKGSRMRLHTLFGFSSPKKQNSGRPVTADGPVPEDICTEWNDVDATPTKRTDVDPTSLLRTTSLGRTSFNSKARCPSPEYREKGKRRGHSFIPRLFKSRSTEREQPEHNQAFEPINADDQPPGSSSPATPTPDTSSNISSPSQSAKTHPPQPKPAISAPKISRIPPIPHKRPSTGSREDWNGIEPRPREGQGHDRNHSIGSTGTSGRWSPRFFGSGEPRRDSGVDQERGLDRDNIPELARNGMEGRGGNGKIAAVKTKHTSFDFEKPSWAGGNAVKSRSVVKPKDSVQNTLPSSRLTENKTAIRDQSIARTASNQPRATGPLKTDHSGASVSSKTPSQSTTNTNNRSALSSLSGSGVGVPGASSSLGRGVASRKPSRANISNGYTHPSFAFEPPVPSASLVDQSKRPRSSRTGRNENESVEGSYHSSRQRRSLDLGLGLAWAPTKVKPEAILQGGFVRSFSAKEGETGNSKVPIGSSVTETFKRVLPERGFIAFKKCGWSFSITFFLFLTTYRCQTI